MAGAVAAPGTSEPAAAVELGIGAGSRIGRYEILDRLGSGGAGIVFRALDPAGGRQVALKVLRLSDPRDLECVRREIHSLSRLRSDGIVKIFEQGIDKGVPWYAMELIEGAPMDALWPRVPCGLDELRPALRAIRTLCGTLAFLHAEGIVHRDLKPGNVVVRPGRAPVLVDFGLAARFGARISRETLDVGGEIMGTLAYMSPEQARGEFVDARADLYSLGCMLYEAVAGRPPYTGAAWEVLDQQLHATPIPPQQLAPAIPDSLAEMISRLLAKRPSDRLGYAADVSSQLGGILGEPEPSETVPASVYLYRPGFSGRKQQIERLDAALSALERGEGGLVLVSGESGVGKTRFAMEGARRATRRGFVVVTGQCVSLESGQEHSQFQGGPLHPLVPLLRFIGDRCRAGGAETTRRLLGRRVRSLAAYEQSLASLPGLEDLPDAVPMPAAVARDRLVVDLAATLRTLSKEMRFALVLDDLQWIDELTLHVLVSLPESFFRDAPILVMGCCRSEERTSSLRRLFDTHSCLTLELGRLDDPDLASIVSDMLAIDAPPRSLTQFLGTRSEGNPFFVSEYLRMVVEEQLLVRSPLGFWKVADGDGSMAAAYERLPTPSTVFSLVQTRLDSAGERARRLARVAAVLGREFDSSLLHAAMGWSDTDHLEAVAELIARHILEESSGDALRFTHDKLREVTYGGLTLSVRADLHRRVATAIESHHGSSSDAPSWFPALALHWSNAGEDGKAAGYYSRAAELALRTGASGDACVFFSRALASDERGSPKVSQLERSRWLRKMGEASYGVGEIADVIVHSSDALASLGHTPARTPTERLAAILVDLPEILRPIAQPGAVRDPVAHEASLAASQASHAYYLTSQLLGGVASGLRCIALARRSGELSIATQAFAQIGYLCGTARLARLARHCFEQARALRDHADPNVFGGSLYFEAISELGEGRCERSRDLGEQAFQLLDGVENRQEAETALAIVANALYYLGRYDDAAERCGLLLESARTRGNTHHTAWGLFLTGRSRMAMGSLSDAIRLLEEGYALLRQGSDVLSLIMCEGSLARALLYAGDFDRAHRVRDALEERLRANPVVALAQCLDGLAALPEVSIELWRRTGGDALGASSRWACGALTRFAVMFPLARPAAWRWRAEYLETRGARRSASYLRRRALASAAFHRQDFEAAGVHQSLARHAASTEERCSHRTLAERLYERLGCDWHLSRVRGCGED